jgi:hypothetical protein
VLLLVAIAATRLQRKTIRVMGVYRKALSSLIFVLCAIICHRIEGLWLGMSLRDVLITDSYIMASFFGVSSVLIWPMMWRNTMLHLASAWVIAFAPQPIAVFIASAALSMLMLVLNARTSAPRPPSPPSVRR